MSFDNFLAAAAKTLPVVGEAVIALHPNNPNEAMKIQVGAQLVQMFVASLHQVATSSVAAAAPAQPADAPT